MGFLASCQGAPSGASLQELEETRILVVVTPGKPGAPSEEIAVTSKGDLVSLSVVRRESGGRVLAEAGRDIPRAELAALWKLVDPRALRTFEPRRTGRRVYDFGRRRLQLEWRESGSRRAHEVSWDGEIENEREIQPFLRGLADLARRYTPEIRLSYFPR